MPKIDAQLGIRVTKDLKSRLEQQARREKKSVSALVVQVMEEYLESKGNGTKKYHDARRICAPGVVFILSCSYFSKDRR